MWWRPVRAADSHNGPFASVVLTVGLLVQRHSINQCVDRISGRNVLRSPSCGLGGRRHCSRGKKSREKVRTLVLVHRFWVPPTQRCCVGGTQRARAGTNVIFPGRKTSNYPICRQDFRVKSFSKATVRSGRGLSHTHSLALSLSHTLSRTQTLTHTHTHTLSPWKLSWWRPAHSGRRATGDSDPPACVSGPCHICTHEVDLASGNIGKC